MHVNTFKSLMDRGMGVRHKRAAGERDHLGAGGGGNAKSGVGGAGEGRVVKTRQEDEEQRETSNQHLSGLEKIETPERNMERPISK